MTVDLEAKTATLFDNDSYETFDLIAIEEIDPEIYIFGGGDPHDPSTITFSKVFEKLDTGVASYTTEHSDGSSIYFSRTGFNSTNVQD